MPLPQYHDTDQHSHQHPEPPPWATARRVGTGATQNHGTAWMNNRDETTMERDDGIWGGKLNEKGPKRHQMTSLGPLVCFLFLLISLIFTNNFFLDTNHDDNNPEPTPATHCCEPLLAGWLSVLNKDLAGGGGQRQGGTMGGEDDDRGERWQGRMTTGEDDGRGGWQQGGITGGGNDRRGGQQWGTTTMAGWWGHPPSGVWEIFCFFWVDFVY